MIFASLILSKWKIKSRKIVDQMRRMKILKKINKQLNSLKFYYRKLSYDDVRSVCEIWNRCSIYFLWKKKFENSFFRLNILFIIKFSWMTERMSILKLYKKYRRFEIKILEIHSKRHECNWIQFNSSIWKWD